MLHLKRLLASLALLSVLSLATCAPVVSTVLAPSTKVPASLLVCPAEPVPGNLVTDADLTDWIQDALDAGAECRANLSAVKGIVNAS